MPKHSALSDCLNPNGYPVSMHTGTASPRPARRRVVSRRGTLERAYEQALPDLAPDLRCALQLWVEAREREWSARSALSTVMTRHNMHWLEINEIARELTAA